MNLKCTLGFHTWDGCTCTGCGKVRDEQHDWSKDCEKCSKCGKTRENQHEYTRDCEECSKCGKTLQVEIGGVCKTCGNRIIVSWDKKIYCIRCHINFKHDWSKDCEKCSKCDKARENQHDWSIDCEICCKCGKTRENQHNWSGCKCLICAKTRDEHHDWNGCTCSKCGKEQHDLQYCKCTKCFKTKHRFINNECINCGDVEQITIYCKYCTTSYTLGKNAMCMSNNELESMLGISFAGFKQSLIITKISEGAGGSKEDARTILKLAPSIGWECDKCKGHNKWNR